MSPKCSSYGPSGYKVIAIGLVLSVLASLVSGQMVSYGMRRLALSMNQFGLDMLRTVDRLYDEERSNNGNSSIPSSYLFCPFCVGSSLAMLMAGLTFPGVGSSRPTQFDHISTGSAYESLRYALYLNSMQPQEIHLAFFDLMRHLQVNLPEGFRAKRSPSPTDASAFETGVALDQSMGNVAQNRLHIINQIYVQRYLPVDYNYYVVTQHYYKTPIRSLDFAYASEESRQHINAMVEHASDGRIQDLLKSDLTHHNQTTSHHLWHTTRLLLLSALYFEGKLDFRQPKRRRVTTAPSQRGTWSNRKTAAIQLKQQRPSVQIGGLVSPNRVGSVKHKPQPVRKPASQSPSTTPISPFTSISSNSSRTEFNPFEPLSSDKGVRSKESIRLRYNHNSYLNCTVVEMPFVGGILSMVALVPANARSMNLLLSRLNAQLIVDMMQGLQIKRVDITLPILNTSHSLVNMERLFSRMGLANVFDRDDDRSLTNTFAGIEHFPLSQVAQMNHKTVIDISIEDDQPSSQQSGHYTVQQTRHRRSAKDEMSVVTSPIMKVVQRHQMQSSDTANAEQLKTSDTRTILKKQERIRINLDEDFLYLIMDNVSGLVISMGRYRT